MEVSVTAEVAAEVVSGEEQEEDEAASNNHMDRPIRSMVRFESLSAETCTFLYPANASL